MEVANGLVTANDYTLANTLQASDVFLQVNLDISFANIYYQLLQPPSATDLRPGAWQWSKEVLATISFQSLERRIAGIRIRSADVGVPATVTLNLLNGYDLGR